MNQKLPLKVKAVSFTGTAWSVVDVGGNDAQATLLEIEEGLVVKATIYPRNSKAVVLAQVDAQMGEGVVTP